MEGPLQGDTAEEEEFEFVEDAENVQDEPSENSKVTHRSRKDLFMSSIEHKVDKTNSMQQERLSHVRNQVLDKIKSTKIKKFRGRTDSISSGVGSTKRRHSFSEDDHAGSSASRPRTSLPLQQ